ncbi:MAG: hypothetical protein NTY19_06905 [Planctomycetota bacterium]|nr:hypothetical protein [Planctomycetota bacterium]
MAEWRFYLQSLLGRGQEAEKRINELLILRGALQGERLSVAEQVQFLRQLETLDTAQQVFLLPALTALFVSPCERIRRQVLDLVLGWIRPRGALGNDLRFLIVSSAEPSRLEFILQQLADLAKGESVGMDLKAPFSALSFLRTPAFIVTTLVGLRQWIRHQPNESELDETYASFFRAEKNADLRRLLEIWAIRGPVFLRYLMMVWMGETGLSPCADLDASEVLLRRYRHDRDPLVAAEAVEAYVRLVPTDGLPAAVSLLMQELKTFKKRDLQCWDRDPGEAFRELISGLIWALGRLAAHHYPAPEPLRALGELLAQPPCNRLDFIPPRNLPRGVTPTSELPEDVAKKIYAIACFLHAQEITIHVRPLRNRAQGNAGFRDAGAPAPVKIDNPQLSPNVFDFEATPNPDSGNDPLTWPLHLKRPWLYGQHSQAANHLLPLISPLLTPTDDPQRRVDSRQEIRQRGPWMYAACHAAAQVLCEVLRRGHRLDQPTIRPIFDYLCKMAAKLSTTKTARSNDQHAPSDASKLKVLTKRLFLNDLLGEEVFSLTNFEEPASNWTPFLVQLAESSLRSLPWEPTYRWISDNCGLLLKIANASACHPKARYSAAVVLWIHAARVGGQLQQDVDAIRWRDPDILSIHHDALCFVEEDVLQEWAAKDEASPGDPRRSLYLAAEQLSRALEVEAGLPDLDLADNWAATCLAEWEPTLKQDQLHHLPFRLLRAYARRPRDLPGNIRRLHDLLLRTCSTAELQFFFDCLPADRKPSERLYRRIAELVEGSRGAISAASSPHFDIQAVKDRLLQESVVRRWLARHARRWWQEDAFSFYLRSRRPPSFPQWGRVIAAEGEILGGAGAAEEDLLATLAPLGQPKLDLAAGYADLVASFVHSPQISSGIRCLARGCEVVPGTVDLHALPLPLEQKIRRLESLVVKAEPFSLLARVVGIERPGMASICLGASVPGLLAHQVVTVEDDVRADDSLLVEVKICTGCECMLVRAEWEWLTAQPADAQVFDFRKVNDQVLRLERAWLARGPALVLKARTSGRKIEREPGMVRCWFNAGFVQCRRDRNGNVIGAYDPWVVLPQDQAPPVGEEVLLRPHGELAFENQSVDTPAARAINVRAIRPPRAQEGSLVRGVIVGSDRNHVGRRRWLARCGELELRIDRDKLTSDLMTLFSLDQLSDEQLAGLGLADHAITFRVTDNGRRASVVAADPQWQATDLILATICQQVAGLTFLRSEGAGVLVFEVRRKGGVAEGCRNSLSPLGLHVRVAEGELFRSTGKPWTARDFENREGYRLGLQVVFGRLLGDGSYQADDEQGIPDLQAVEDKDSDLNLRCRDAFRPDSLVRVRMEGQSLRLVPPPDLGVFPLHEVDVRTDDRTRHAFQRTADNEREALVSNEWKPAAEEFRLEVRLPREKRLLSPDNSGPGEVVRLLNLERGMPLKGSLRAYQERAVFVNGLRVDLDPLWHYLLPRPMSLDDVLWHAQGRALGVTAVVNRKERPRSPETMPEELPFLKQGGEVTGLVVGTPRSNESHEVAIRWVGGTGPDGEPKVADEMRLAFDDNDLRSFHPGHVVRARLQNGRVRLDHIQRDVTGSLFYETTSPDNWAAAFREWASADEAPRGVLLAGPDARRGWLFVMAPAHLVEIPAAKLSGVELLRDAWKLDVVEFAREAADGDVPRFCVTGVEPCLFRSWLGQPLELLVHGWRWEDRVFTCSILPPGDDPQGVPMGFSLSEAGISPLAAPQALRDRLLYNHERDIRLPCTLRGYDLGVTRHREASDLRTRWLCRLLPSVAVFRPDATIETAQQKSLADTLRECNGRIESEGWLHKDNSGTRSVQFEQFPDEPPVPLPEEEQTWIRFSRPLPNPGDAPRPFVVFQTPDGPRASLRRLPPLSLGEWLRSVRLSPNGGPVTRKLYYFGKLSAEQLAECDRRDWAEGEEYYVLFEVEPGVSLAARPSQLTFHGAKFDPTALVCGDIVNQFLVTPPPEPEAECGMEILDILPDISSEIEKFDRLQGIHFGSVSLRGDIVMLKMLRGVNFRTDVVDEGRRGRWRFVLVPPDERQMAWLRDMEWDDQGSAIVYLKFDHVDRDRGELFFRLASVEDVFKERNLIWVRLPGSGEAEAEIAEFGKIKRLRALPLQTPSLRRSEGQKMYISDSRFSTRRGRLHSLVIPEQGRIRLVCVRGEDDQGTRQLSLLEIPPRPFSFLPPFATSCRAILITCPPPLRRSS